MEQPGGVDSPDHTRDLIYVTCQSDLDKNTVRFHSGDECQRLYFYFVATFVSFFCVPVLVLLFVFGVIDLSDRNSGVMWRLCDGCCNVFVCVCVCVRVAVLFNFRRISCA